MATNMAAVTAVGAMGSVGVHALQNPSKVTEQRAKVLRERHRTRVEASERIRSMAYPDDATCFAIVHECFRLRREGYSAVGEIDDVVAAKYSKPDKPITGAMVQDIVIFYAESKVRELEAVRQLQLNALDYMRDAAKETFQSAPGRGI